MLNPRPWFRAVTSIGLAQAGLSAASVAWAAYDVRAVKPAPSDPSVIHLSLSAFVSVLLPFLAYAADSRHVLLRHPRRATSYCQVTAGLIGLSLSLAALHCFVMVQAAHASGIYLVYLLIFPAFIVGSYGAAAGILLGFLFCALRDR